jgi:hypothetical protein
MAYNQMVAYGRDGRGGDGRGDRGGRDRDGRGWGRGRGWGNWNDWGFFGLPYPVYAQQPLVYAAPAPQPLVYAAPSLPQYAAAPVMVVGADSSLAGPAGVITPLGFKTRKIRKHKTRTVIARPQVPYQPSVLYIPREVAKHFEICSVRVGQVLILGSRDPIPAEMYSNEGCGGPAMIQLPPLIPGQHVYLTVRNHSSRSHHFRAALNGISLF